MKPWSFLILFTVEQAEGEQQGVSSREGKQAEREQQGVSIREGNKLHIIYYY